MGLRCRDGERGNKRSRPALPGILVVERSTTLNHLLKRTLTAAGIVARSELTSYFETIDHLRRSAELEQPFGLLLAGAPGRMTREFTQK